MNYDYPKRSSSKCDDDDEVMGGRIQKRRRHIQITEDKEDGNVVVLSRVDDVLNSPLNDTLSLLISLLRHNDEGLYVVVLSPSFKSRRLVLSKRRGLSGNRLKRCLYESQSSTVRLKRETVVKLRGIEFFLSEGCTSKRVWLRDDESLRRQAEAIVATMASSPPSFSSEFVVHHSDTCGHGVAAARRYMCDSCIDTRWIDVPGDIVTRDERRRFNCLAVPRLFKSYGETCANLKRCPWHRWAIAHLAWIRSFCNDDDAVSHLAERGFFTCGLYTVDITVSSANVVRRYTDLLLVHEEHELSFVHRGGRNRHHAAAATTMRFPYRDFIDCRLRAGPVMVVRIDAGCYHDGGGGNDDGSEKRTADVTTTIWINSRCATADVDIKREVLANVCSTTIQIMHLIHWRRRTAGAAPSQLRTVVYNNTPPSCHCSRRRRSPF